LEMGVDAGKVESVKTKNVNPVSKPKAPIEFNVLGVKTSIVPSILS
jgi:hypothetical protein